MHITDLAIGNEIHTLEVARKKLLDKRKELWIIPLVVLCL